MYAYAKKYQTSEIWLLYPITDEMRHHEPIIFESNDNVKVQIYFIDLAHIETSLSELKEMLIDDSKIKGLSPYSVTP
jgi:5-methylcytosine-specific restriction enzyme subunit McrC